MPERGRYNRPTNPRAPRIDREKTCPFLVRVFVRPGQHNQDSDYTVDRVPPSEEHQLYTWRDSTLRELLLLLRDVAPPLRTSPLARYSLRLVFYDAQRASYASKDLGTLSTADVLSPSPLGRADKTLDEARFVVGDYIDVAFLPGPPGLVAPVEPGRGSFTRDPVPHFGARDGPAVRGSFGGATRGAPGGGRGGFGGPLGRGGFAQRGEERRGTSWGASAPAGTWGRSSAGAAPSAGLEGRRPADQGWGARRESKDDRAPVRRRDSRSRSPARRRSPSPVARGKDGDVEMK